MTITNYYNHIVSISDLFDVELVVKDEIEKFREYSSKLYNYPFQLRRSHLTDVILDLEKVSTNNYSYSYDSHIITFRETVVCLEPNVFEVLNIFTKFYNKVIEIYHEIS